MGKLMELFRQPSSAAGATAVYAAADGVIADSRITTLRVVQFVLGLYAIFRSETATPTATPMATSTITSVSASVVVAKDSRVE